MLPQAVYLDIVIMALLGAAIGFICRGRLLAEFLLSIGVSIAYGLISAWLAGTISNEVSVHDLSGTVYYLWLPYVCFYFSPVLFASLGVGWLRRRLAG